MGLEFERNTGAGIRNRENNPPARRHFREGRLLAWLERERRYPKSQQAAGRHCIPGINRQIGYRLLYLGRVHIDGIHRLIRLYFQSNMNIFRDGPFQQFDVSLTKAARSSGRFSTMDWRLKSRIWRMR